MSGYRRVVVWVAVSAVAHMYPMDDFNMQVIKAYVQNNGLTEAQENLAGKDDGYAVASVSLRRSKDNNTPDPYDLYNAFTALLGSKSEVIYRTYPGQQLSHGMEKVSWCREHSSNEINYTFKVGYNQQALDSIKTDEKEGK